jgi:hypothetical protein
MRYTIQVSLFVDSASEQAPERAADYVADAAFRLAHCGGAFVGLDKVIAARVTAIDVHGKKVIEKEAFPE